MGLFPTISKLPKAHSTHICHVHALQRKAQCNPKGSFPVGTDGWIKFPKEGDMIVLLPYLDLPFTALKEENAIGFLTMQGDRVG